jgi:hypothetical protein
VACSIFPREIVPALRSWAERVYSNLIYWNELERGGHFAALAQPAPFTQELRNAFRSLRRGPPHAACRLRARGAPVPLIAPGETATKRLRKTSGVQTLIVAVSAGYWTTGKRPTQGGRRWKTHM